MNIDRKKEKDSLNKAKPKVTDRILFLCFMFSDIWLYFISKHYNTFMLAFRQLSPRYLVWTGKIRAKRVYYYALRKVPAYKEFTKNSRIDRWIDIPVMDKEVYIKAYPPEQRCLNGKIPLSKVMIDESSGSTGTPYNWVRSLAERSSSHVFVSYFATFCFGKKPWITINAFSMGAWATGTNIGIALQRNGIVKNTGPDIEKIIHTIEFFGSKYDYLITGYPPFLKYLMDYANEKKIPWDKYTISALVGGEGMSEGLRDYLLSRFKKVYSGYGATDLEIGIAGETPITVAIRRLARSNPEIKMALFGEDSRLPMIFQYNPLMHYIETNSSNELIFTITRKAVLSPRIRYNIHDTGGVCRYDEMRKKLQNVGYDIDKLIKNEKTKNIVFPFVWVYGRQDFTISIMGANIYPEDIEQCLYADAELAKITRSFCQSILEDKESNARPAFYFEIAVRPTEELKQRFAESILTKLISLNADFREAYREYVDTMKPAVYLFPIGEGPFKNDQSKIKQTRLLKIN
jgi:phenylacetate-CoA ligase